MVERKNLASEQQLEAEKNLFTARQNLLKEQEVAEKKLAEEEKKLLDEQIKRIDEYENTLNARVDTLRSFVGLFSEVDKKTEVSGKQLLTNLEDQVKLFEGWQADMEKLASSDGMTLTDEELKKYAEKFTQLGDLIQDQAKVDIPPLEIPLSLNTDLLICLVLPQKNQRKP